MTRSSFGTPDTSRAARQVLKDYVNARLLSAHPPPGMTSDDYMRSSRERTMRTLGEKKRAPITHVGKNSDTFVPAAGSSDDHTHSLPPKSSRQHGTSEGMLLPLLDEAGKRDPMRSMECLLQRTVLWVCNKRERVDQCMLNSGCWDQMACHCLSISRASDQWARPGRSILREGKGRSGVGKATIEPIAMGSIIVH